MVGFGGADEAHKPPRSNQSSRLRAPTHSRQKNTAQRRHKIMKNCPTAKLALTPHRVRGKMAVQIASVVTYHRLVLLRWFFNPGRLGIDF